ncbi:hypothetical protein [Flavonifractor sp. An100]|uniref:hypothetical protein n=1 Tax=Flavonifractor sp. An100 TaxID=1965538 RepID=UPI001FA82207|nr:hypothetical protein [Flavonifractor sp. An100]
MAVGTVTTGDPGTNAEVTNSGTSQNAVFDFTIPRGATGSSAPVSLLSAYSTPPQPGASGDPVLFDKNGLSYGSDVSHTAGSGTVTLQTPGVYTIAFHGNVAPGAGSEFPLSITLNLMQDGSTVPGGSVLHTFNNSSDTANLAFSVPVQVTNAPSTLEVEGSGGNYLYSAVALTAYRLGDIPSGS